MDRSRRGGAKQDASPATAVPATSRLRIRPKRNRRRPASLWSRLPRRREVIDACGRAVRRSLPALAATAVILALGTGLWLGYRFVTTSERFALASIEVTGTSQLSPDAIRAALPAKIGDNIFVTDLDDLTATLRRDPWVRSARAHRVLPDTIVVEIREQVALAMIQIGNELYLVDETGAPFKRAQLAAGEGAGLPIVTGITRERVRTARRDTADLVLRALGVLERWRTNPLRPEISEIHVDAQHAITLRTYDRAVAIQLGAIRDLDTRLATFDAAWNELTDSERDRVTALHLDARADQVTVAFAKD